jgi:biotin transporter BioY
MRIANDRATFMDSFVKNRTLLWDVVLVVGFAILTALCAQVCFWIGPVPITGQTFAVILAGALLGSRRGALSQFSYLAIGLTGIPFWFAPGPTVGIARLLGPTGGYLIGFVAAAFIVGLLAERAWDKKLWTSVLAMLAGCAVYFAFGLSWLVRFVPESTVLQVGLYPFIAGDLMKVAAAALMLPAGWWLLNKYTS